MYNKKPIFINRHSRIFLKLLTGFFSETKINTSEPKILYLQFEPTNDNKILNIHKLYHAFIVKHVKNITSCLKFQLTSVCHGPSNCSNRIPTI